MFLSVQVQKWKSDFSLLDGAGGLISDGVWLYWSPWQGEIAAWGGGGCQLRLVPAEWAAGSLLIPGPPASAASSAAGLQEAVRQALPCS